MNYYIKAKTISSLEKVFPDREAHNEEKFNSVLLGEWLNFQLVYKNEGEDWLKRLKINVVGDLSEFVKIRYVDYVPVVNPCARYDEYYIDTKCGIYPDVLRETNIETDVSIPGGRQIALWVSIKPLCDKKYTGNHSLYFRLYTENGKLINTLKYEVKVIGARLEESDICLTHWMHYDCIANYHNVEPFSADFYQVFDSYLSSYVEMGNNMLLIPLFTPPLDTAIGYERRTAQLVEVKKVMKRYEFNFNKLEFFIRRVMSFGIRHLEFSHLFTQWGGKNCPKIIAEENGEKKRIFGWDTSSSGEEYVRFLSQFLPSLENFLKENGWHGISFLHLTDEPTERDYKKYAQLHGIVKKYTDIPTLDALSEVKFFEEGLVDYPAPYTSASENFYKKNYRDIFVYYCGAPSIEWYSNRHINMPSQRTRIIGFQLYLNRVKGFLHWGFNFYNSVDSYCGINPYTNNDACGGFPPGDAFLVYPCGKGCIASIRYELMKEAFQDYRALKTLEKYYGRKKVEDILRKEKIEGFNVYPRSAEWHTRLRQRINKLIGAESNKQKNSSF